MKSPKFFATWLKNFLVKQFKIHVDEAQFELDQYDSFGHFFSRRLKSGAREISQEGLASPCDGRLQSFEEIQSETLLQSKGINYSLFDLLGEEDTSYFGGLAITIYLAPYNYHRVHAPDDLKILRSKKISGDLWPVNRSSVEKIHPLFCINERWIMESQVGDIGKMSIVMVGATNVGNMEVFHLSESQNIDPMTNIIHEESVALNRGDELGVFHMGSTVILILDRNLSEHYKMQLSSCDLRCGEKIG